MLKFNDLKSARHKYADHRLFEKCIEIWCPVGWISYLDEVVGFLEKHNKLCADDQKVIFSQVKVKFNILTIYIQPMHAGSDLWSQAVSDAGIYDFIKEISISSSKHCTFCGKKLIEMVFESRIKNVCMDHLPNGKYGKN